MGKRLFQNQAVVATVALFVLGCAILYKAQKPSGPAFRDFAMEESVQEDAITHFYQFANGSSVLKLKVIPKIAESEAKKIMEGKILTMEALYGNEMSPYPGMISNEIVCAQDMTPKKQVAAFNGLSIHYFRISLTNRLTYGSCVESETPYRGFIAWTFCPDKMEYRQLELIYPKDKFDEKGLEFIKGNICN